MQKYQLVSPQEKSHFLSSIPGPEVSLPSCPERDIWEIKATKPPVWVILGGGDWKGIAPPKMLKTFRLRNYLYMGVS